MFTFVYPFLLLFTYVNLCLVFTYVYRSVLVHVSI